MLVGKICPNFLWASVTDIFIDTAFAVSVAFEGFAAMTLYSLSLWGMVAMV